MIHAKELPGKVERESVEIFKEGVLMAGTRLSRSDKRVPLGAYLSFLSLLLACRMGSV
jgi:hypothetical protein